jgi:hypothetical protein
VKMMNDKEKGLSEKPGPALSQFNYDKQWKTKIQQPSYKKI